MKKRDMRHGRYLSFYHLTFLFLFVFGINKTVFSQTVNLTWPAGGATVSDNQLSMNHAGDWINCDMYTDCSGLNPSGSFFAIAYDEYDASSPTPWTSKIEVMDWVDGSVFTITINNARHPDVVIADENNAAGTQGNVVVSFVYEDVSSSPSVIKFHSYWYDGRLGFWTNGTANNHTTNSTFTNPITVSSASGDAFTPHIDAVPRVISSFSNFWGAGNSYIPLPDVVITWTEDNSGNEIYAARYRAQSGTNVTTRTYIADGENSDVAGALQYDGVNYSQYSYFTFVDNSGDLQYADWDFSGTINTNLLESSVTINGLPRIDGMNYEDRSGTTPFIPWTAIAEIDNSSSPVIHSYDNPSGIVTYESYVPFSLRGGAQGYMPVVAAGAGPDCTAPVSGTTFGNLEYLEGFTIDRSGTPELYALVIDMNSNYNGYNQINNTSLHGSLPLPSPLALSTSSNCGQGHLAAWLNLDAGAQPQIFWKVNTSNTMSFKPTAINSIVATDINTYPNPAHDIININGLEEDSKYVLYDMQGRTVGSGVVHKADSKVDISQLSSGLYTFKVNTADGDRAYKFYKE